MHGCIGGQMTIGDKGGGSCFMARMTWRGILARPKSFPSRNALRPPNSGLASCGAYISAVSRIFFSESRRKNKIFLIGSKVTINRDSVVNRRAYQFEQSVALRPSFQYIAVKCIEYYQVGYQNVPTLH